MQVNTVGFYQLSKICITPAVLVFDAVTSKTYPTRKEIAAVCVLCIGVTLATVADGSVSTNLVGFLIAIAAICTTAVYQVLLTTCQEKACFAGCCLALHSKRSEHGLAHLSMQSCKYASCHHQGCSLIQPGERPATLWHTVAEQMES